MREQPEGAWLPRIGQGRFRTPGPLGVNHRLADSSPCGLSDGGKTEEHRHYFRWWAPADTKEEFKEGFDEGDFHTMQSLLVSVGGHRLVTRRWHDKGMRVYSDQPGIATVDPVGRNYQVHGVAPGPPAVLHAVNSNGICRSALAVFVKRLYEVPVAFHAIVDNQGQRSNRGGSQTEEMLRDVNAIFEKQTCLTFRDLRPNKVERHEIPLDLGRKVKVELIWRQLRQHEVPGAINVFLVWALEQQGFHRTGGLMAYNQIYLADGPQSTAGKFLAHEIGHFLTQVQGRGAALGYSDSHAAHAGLMDPDASTTEIRRKEADYMYADATLLGWFRGAFLDKGK